MVALQSRIVITLKPDLEGLMREEGKRKEKDEMDQEKLTSKQLDRLGTGGLQFLAIGKPLLPI